MPCCINKRIINLANPVDNQDAVTKYYLENTWLSPTNKTALTTVNDNISNINAVNSNASNINTVATDLLGSNTIGTVATDLAGSDNIGTVATNNPAKPEDIFCSAFVIRYQGPINSAIV